jgi:Dehydrogenases with different specificities (related to short-chain alcohol dehydrogenases)
VRGGVGRSVALTLTEDHDIAINYRVSDEAATEVVELAKKGSNVITVRTDVCNPEAVESMIAEVVNDLGGLDAVINNAGIIEPDLVTDIDNQQWDQVLDTNLIGAFYITRTAIPHLEPDGDIVLISSIGGTGGTVDASYAASKAGLHGLTRSLVREYGDRGLQVNVAAPGPVEIEMNDTIVKYLEAVDFRGHENVDTQLPEYACQPEYIAHTVEYLLENKYIYGEIANINGGMQFQ